MPKYVDDQNDPDTADGPGGLERLEVLAEEISTHKDRIASLEIPDDQPIALMLREEMAETLMPLMLDIVELASHAIMDVNEDLDEAVADMQESIDEVESGGAEVPAESVLYPEDAANIATLLGALRLTVAQAAADAANAGDKDRSIKTQALLAHTDATLARVGEMLVERDSAAGDGDDDNEASPPEDGTGGIGDGEAAAAPAPAPTTGTSPVLPTEDTPPA